MTTSSRSCLFIGSDGVGLTSNLVGRVRPDPVSTQEMPSANSTMRLIRFIHIWTGRTVRHAWKGGPMPLRVYLEEGSKKTFAVALDWPGWARAGKGAEAALDSVEAYLPRYAPVVRRAGLEPPEVDGFEIVERFPGGGATDFGTLDKGPKADEAPLAQGETDRLAALVRAAWEVFDEVAAGAPAELRKGPRGGGRDRDKIVAHVMGAEASYIRMLGLKASTTGQDVPDPTWRPAVLEIIRSAAGSGPLRDRGWTPRYAARRIAWHVLDHAWEIEDRSGS
jgi:hypothetical protein